MEVSLETTLKALEIEMKRIEVIDIDTYNMAKETIEKLLEAIRYLL
jgi:hypothetical protein